VQADRDIKLRSLDIEAESLWQNLSRHCVLGFLLPLLVYEPLTTFDVTKHIKLVPPFKKKIQVYACYGIPRRLRITERQFYSGTSRGAGSAGKSDVETGSDEWIRSRGVETSKEVGVPHTHGDGCELLEIAGER